MILQLSMISFSRRLSLLFLINILFNHQQEIFKTLPVPADLDPLWQKRGD